MCECVISFFITGAFLNLFLPGKYILAEVKILGKRCQRASDLDN